ncbi:MAG: hypothetical protein AB1Z16_09885 [Desulfotignum sp.]
MPLPIFVDQVTRQKWTPPAKGYDHLSSRIKDLAIRLKKEAAV